MAILASDPENEANDPPEEQGLSRAVHGTSGLEPLELLERFEPARGFDTATCPALVYVRGLESEHSRYTMTRALQTLAVMLRGPGEHPEGDIDLRTVPWAALRYQHTSALRARIVERYAPATAGKLLAALRGTLREAARLGLCSREDAEVAADLRNPKGTQPLAGRWVRAEELRALVRAAGPDARLRALLALLYGCGLRREELVVLDAEHYERTEQRLRVFGKRRKVRLAYLNAATVATLDAWMRERGDEPGPLIPSRARGHGPNALRRMGPDGVRVVLMRLARRAGLAKLTPHDMRRTFVSDLLDAGNDALIVSRMVGHDNPKTTLRYDRRGEQQAREAIETLTMPDVDDE